MMRQNMGKKCNVKSSLEIKKRPLKTVALAVKWGKLLIEKPDKSMQLANKNKEQESSHGRLKADGVFPESEKLQWSTNGIKK